MSGLPLLTHHRGGDSALPASCCVSHPSRLSGLGKNVPLASWAPHTHAGQGQECSSVIRPTKPPLKWGDSKHLWILLLTKGAGEVGSHGRPLQQAPEGRTATSHNWSRLSLPAAAWGKVLEKVPWSYLHGCGRKQWEAEYASERPGVEAGIGFQ